LTSLLIITWKTNQVMGFCQKVLGTRALCLTSLWSIHRKSDFVFAKWVSQSTRSREKQRSNTKPWKM